MSKKYIVRLTDEEREVCEATVKNEKGKSEELRRAMILLKADMDGPAWNDEKIGEALVVAFGPWRTCGGSLFWKASRPPWCARSRQRLPLPNCLDGAAEAKLIALRVGKPPTGYGHWTHDCSPTNWSELEVVESIGPETVRQTLKKIGMTRRKIEYWVVRRLGWRIRRAMEEVLETYEKAYDPASPVVCMDERPVQLIGETRMPIPATKEHPERVDYEYERKGTAAFSCSPTVLASGRQRRDHAAPRRLGPRSRPVTRHSVCGYAANHTGLRQSEHTYQRGVLRSVPSRESP